MTFTELGLNPLLVRNLRQMGYRQPRQVQAESIGPAIDGRDVLGLAATGTGKTAAFVAPIAHNLLASRPESDGETPVRKGKGRGKGKGGAIRPRVSPSSRLRALVLCPTRELAQQVERETARIVAGTVLRTVCVYGKVGMQPQVESVRRGVDILFGTPGRVRDLVDAGAVSLAHVRHVVLDEADRMMDMGFRPQVAGLLARMPTPRQTLLFTATMPRALGELTRKFLDDPVRIEIGRHTRAAAHLHQRLVPVDDRLKVPMLLHLLQHGHGSGVLIFCRTRRRVGWVGTALLRQGLRVGMIHGDRTQSQRNRALARFADGPLDIVVATDVASRGLHIPSVRTVINYDLPLAPEEYVHRVGRAGHGGGFGESFTLLGRSDQPRWASIARAAAVDLEPETIEGFQPPEWWREPLGERKSSAKRTAGAKPPAVRRLMKESKKTGRSAADSKKDGRLVRRSRRSRAIGKDQKPGTGVRRTGAS